MSDRQLSDTSGLTVSNNVSAFETIAQHPRDMTVPEFVDHLSELSKRNKDMPITDGNTEQGFRSEERRDSEREPLAKPLGATRKIHNPQWCEPETSHILALGEQVEHNTDLRDFTNAEIAAELAKIASYGVGDNSRAAAMLRVAAMRLTKANVEVCNWKDFIPVDRLSKSELIDFQVLHTGAVVTYYVEDREARHINVYTADQSGRLLEQRVMSPSASEEYVHNMQAYTHSRRNRR